VDESIADAVGASISGAVGQRRALSRQVGRRGVTSRDMQTIEQYAAEVRAKWKADGCPPCDHKSWTKDRMRYGGADSGDKACDKCGAEWYGDNAPPPQPGGCPEE
jgi:hypothetical protein